MFVAAGQNHSNANCENNKKPVEIFEAIYLNVTICGKKDISFSLLVGEILCYIDSIIHPVTSPNNVHVEICFLKV